MRVLGRSEETKNECAICKQDMKNVVFHDSPFDFNSIKIGKVGLESKLQLYFTICIEMALFINR